MTAAVADRPTRTREGDELSPDVFAGAKIYGGTMVQKNATGFAVPATATVANKTLGIAKHSSDNTGGASGDIKARIRRNIIGVFANSASGDLITIADIGNDCYVVDDSTVAKTNGGSTRPVAGKIMDVDSFGVHVLFV